MTLQWEQLPLFLWPLKSGFKTSLIATNTGCVTVWKAKRSKRNPACKGANNRVAFSLWVTYKYRNPSSISSEKSGVATGRVPLFPTAPPKSLWRNALGVRLRNVQYGAQGPLGSQTWKNWSPHMLYRHSPQFGARQKPSLLVTAAMQKHFEGNEPIQLFKDTILTH